EAPVLVENSTLPGCGDPAGAGSAGDGFARYRISKLAVTLCKPHAGAFRFARRGPWRARLAVRPDGGARLVRHDDVRPIVKAKVATAVKRLDLQQPHAVAHRALREVVDRQPVRPGLGCSLDREALRAVARRDVGVELTARRQLLVAVPGVAAVR